METLSAFAKAVASIFTWMTGRNAVKNAPDVKAAAKGQAEADAIAETNAELEKEDTDEIRKKLAE